MEKFKRRYYGSLGQLGQDVVWPFRHRKQLKRALGGELVSFAFRERLMLAVTAVNDCRYCSYFHTQEALKANLSETEIQTLLDGTFDDAPAEELPALLYAQHWAESDAQPDPAARQTLIDSYGQEKVDAIETVLRMIRTGNLAGNTADYILYRLSWGRLGASEEERATIK
ncbi:MAG: carboxymuconolactone decarboxylase family protein [Anaerolineae bacterium]|nr:carboxymuconolactone decarboxylase family protein [Anaerolineae bacterium]